LVFVWFNDFSGFGFENNFVVLKNMRIHEDLTFPEDKKDTGDFSNWEKLKNNQEKIDQLKQMRSKGSLDNLNESEIEKIISWVTELLNQTQKNKQFPLTCDLFEIFVPAGRSDFSKKTFADIFASRLSDLLVGENKKVGSQFLNILSQAIYDSDSRINPAETLQIYGRLKALGENTKFFNQSITFLLDNPEHFQKIEQEIENSLNQNETRAIIYLKILEEFFYERLEDHEDESDSNDQSFENSPYLQNLERVVSKVKGSAKSVLVKRIAESISQNLNFYIKNGARRGRSDEPRLPQTNLELDEGQYLSRLSKDYYGIFSEESRRPVELLKNNSNDKKPIDLNEAASFTIRKTSSKDKARQEEAATLFSFFSQDEVIQKMTEDFGFDIKDLTLREQIWFVNSLRGYKPEQEKIVSDFTKKFGLAGARAFLSCEYSDGFRDIVLSIGETLPEELARQVFEQYGQLALLAQEKSEELAREFLTEDGETKINAVAVEQELLDRAKNFLVEVSKAQSVSAEAVVEKLQRHETAMVVFAGIFKTTFKHADEINFDLVRGLNFEEMTAAEISTSTEAQEQMLLVAGLNWQEVPSMKDFVVDLLKKSFEATESPTKFYLLKKAGRIIAFGRFDQTETGHLHAGSFNVDRDLRNSAIGDAMFKNTFDEEAKKNVITAEAYPDSRVAMAYVEKYGFIITGVEEVALPDGQKEFGFKILRDDEATASLITRHLEKEELMERAQKFVLPEDKEKMLDVVRLAEKQEMVVTRFFSDPNNSNVRYMVFEEKTALQKKLAG